MHIYLQQIFIDFDFVDTLALQKGSISNIFVEPKFE